MAPTTIDVIPDAAQRRSGICLSTDKSPVRMRARNNQISRTRPANATDTDFILSLVPRFVACELPKGRRKRECIAAIRTDLERVLADTPPGDHFFIAELSDGTPTGFLHLQVQQDFFSDTRSCHVSDVAVAKAYDGQGIGHGLLEHARKWAKANRCKRLTLSVFPGNARALALYERVGFSPDLLRMTKPL